MADRPRTAADVVVIGAGVIGLTLARRLAGAGRRVVVVDRAAGGGATSRAAAGLLAPRAEADEPGPFFDLALASRRAFRDFVAELAGETGLEPDFREDGLLALAFDVHEESRIARRAEWQRAAGLVVEELTRTDAASRWPDLVLGEAPAPGAAARFAEGRLFFFPDEAQVDPGRLVDALLAACRARGVELRLGVEAVGLRLAEGKVEAVSSSEGEIACGLAIEAAGAWAGAVAGWAGETLPVEPVRGELLAYVTRLTPPQPIVTAGPAYALLRDDRRLLVGATVERAGFAGAPTPAGQAWLEAQAAALVPSLAGKEPVARWAGLRPGTPDGLPVIGFSAEVENLYHATGHFRNGILLAPATADLAMRELEAAPGARPPPGPFTPERFMAAEGLRS
jgi:glycine oxidase